MTISSFIPLSVTPVVDGLASAALLPTISPATTEVSAVYSPVAEVVTAVFKRSRPEMEPVSDELEEELHTAVVEGSEERVISLLARGADPDFENEQGLSALQVAACMCSSRIMRILIGGLADVGVETLHKESLYHLVIKSPRAREAPDDMMEILELLHKAGLDPDQLDGRGNTPLHVSASRGRLHAVTFLLAHGCSGFMENNLGCTPLHLAAENGNRAVVEALIEESDIEARDHSGRVPLHYAADENHVHLLPLLASEENIDICDMTGCSPLMLSVLTKSEEGVKSLMDLGAEVDLGNARGNTALHLATQRGLIAAVRALLTFGAAPNVLNNKANAPIHYAAMHNDPELSELLIAMGADISLVNDDRETPLILAAEEGASDVVKLYTEKYKDKACIDAIDKFGITAYIRAITNGFFEIADVIGCDEYSKSLLAVKALAQVSGIDAKVKIGGVPRALLGFDAGYFCHSAPCFDLPKEVEEAFTVAEDRRKDGEFLERLRSNRLAILSTGSRGHSLFIVILGSKMILCNRGFGSEGYSTMKAMSIDPALFDAKILQMIRDVEDHEEEGLVEPFFYAMLPKKLLARPETIEEKKTNRQIESIAPSDQKCGNCTAASFKTAIRAALALTSLEERGELTSDELEAVKERSKELSFQIRLFYEDALAAAHSVCPILSREDYFALVLESRLKRHRMLEDVFSISIPIDLIASPKICDLIFCYSYRLKIDVTVYASDAIAVFPADEMRRILGIVKELNKIDARDENFLSMEVLKDGIVTAFYQKIALLSTESRTALLRQILEVVEGEETEDLEKWIEDHLLENSIAAFEILEDGLLARIVR